MNKKFIQYKKGAASISMVMFAALLLTIIVVSFIKIMLRDQKQATDHDLSQSAYDSALIGVEDAKRALIKYKSNICKNSSTQCRDLLKSSLSNNNCDAIKNILEVNSFDQKEKEYSVKLNSSNSENDTNQAYTCVKINFNTSDYLGSLKNNNDQIMFPINPAPGLDNVAKNVKYIRLNWYNQKDLSNPSSLRLNYTYSNTNDYRSLYTSDNEWTSIGNHPPVIIAQYFKLVDNLSDYDINSQSKSYKTLFLYPSQVGLDRASFNLDGRNGGTSTTVKTRCSTDISSSKGGYACQTTIELPEVVPGNSLDKYFIRLAKRYSSTANIKVELLDESQNIVNFYGVQPSVDSNGRANDLFRRVEARVVLDGDNSSIPFPSGALEIGKGDFCKDMIVYDDKTIFNTDCK